MNCKCQEVFNKISGIIAAKSVKFDRAFQDGPGQVLKVKTEVINDIQDHLKGKLICNCFTGQILRKISVAIEEHFVTNKMLERECNLTAIENEKEKLFNKVILLLNTK